MSSCNVITVTGIISMRTNVITTTVGAAVAVAVILIVAVVIL